MKKIINIIRIPVVVAVFAALIAQFIYSMLYLPNLGVVSFFSFFTVESNLFAAVILLVSAYISLTGTPNRQLEYLRGAATLYMVVVGVIYFILLRGNEVALGTIIPWVNFILHYAFPVYMLLDWIVTPLTHKLRLKIALLWLIFPFLYLVYSLIRGAIVGWYPYPFLNPANGLSGVVIASIGITVLCFGLAFGLTRKPTIRNF